MNASRPRRAWQAIDGVVMLDKPPGLSSNQALQAVRRLYNAAKGGHTGTLDPLATGLLPLCFGEATKFSGNLLNADKRYRAVLRLGIVTDTADAEGEVLSTAPVTADATAVRQALHGFVGAIRQLPPMHSALKRDGKPLYAYAREGITLDREPREVTIYAITVVDIRLPDVEFDVHCSKGTYVRTLAADVGEVLGCGGHLAALRRTGIGPFDLGAAITLPELETLSPEQRAGRLQPVDYLIGSLPALCLDATDERRIGHGQSIPWAGGAPGAWRLHGAGGRFLGLGLLDAAGILHPERLCAGAAPAGSSSTNSCAETAENS